MGHDYPLIMAAALYIVAAVLLYKSVRTRSDSQRAAAFGLAIGGAVIHAFVQALHWFGQPEPDVSLPHLMSLCALVIIVLLIASSISQRKLFSAGLVALPVAAGVLLLEWIVPPHEIPLTDASLGTAVQPSTGFALDVAPMRETDLVSSHTVRVLSGNTDVTNRLSGKLVEGNVPAALWDYDAGVKGASARTVETPVFST